MKAGTGPGGEAFTSRVDVALGSGSHRRSGGRMGSWLYLPRILRTVREGAASSSTPPLSSCGWTNNKSNINRRKTNFNAHEGLTEMRPKKWPKQAAFILIRQGNNTFVRN